MKVKSLIFLLFLFASKIEENFAADASQVNVEKFTEADVGTTPAVYKPAIIRTELRFGRNLDPEKVRVVNVKSNTGEDVEILVGKDSRRAKAGGTSSFFVRNNYQKPQVLQPHSEAANTNGSRNRRPIEFSHTSTLLKQNDLVQQNKDYNERKAAAEERQRQQIELQIQKIQNAFREKGLAEKRAKEEQQAAGSTRADNARKLRYKQSDFDQSSPQNQWQPLQQFSDEPHYFSQEHETKRSAHFRPAYIPLNEGNGFRFPGESSQNERRLQKRHWQPQEVNGMRSQQMQQAKNRLTPFSFSSDFQSSLRPLFNAAFENFNNYFRGESTDGRRSQRPHNLITKKDFIQPVKKQQTFLPATYVVSSSVPVFGDDFSSNTASSSGSSSNAKRNIIKIGNTKTKFHYADEPTRPTVVDGPAVTLIEGVRVPDTPEDKVATWRNARVLNNQLVPYPLGYTPPKVQFQSFAS